MDELGERSSVSDPSVVVHWFREGWVGWLVSLWMHSGMLFLASLPFSPSLALTASPVLQVSLVSVLPAPSQTLSSPPILPITASPEDVFVKSPDILPAPPEKPKGKNLQKINPPATPGVVVNTGLSYPAHLKPSPPRKTTMKPSTKKVPPANSDHSVREETPQVFPSQDISSHANALEPQSLMEAAVPVFAPQPKYPRMARKRGLEGTVILVVELDAEGKISDVRIQSGSGFALLDDAALSIVEEWRFTPARMGGIAIRSTLKIPILFQLVDESFGHGRRHHLD